MADINEWSPVDESNTATPPAGWPEGMSPSAVNNTARAMMGAIRRWYDTVTAQLAGFLPLYGGVITGDLHVTGTTYAANVEATYLHTTAIAADTQVGATVIAAYQYNLRGYIFANTDVTDSFTKISDPAGSNITMYAGDNYYDNNTHTFRSRGGSAYVVFNSGGTFNVNGSWGIISDATLKTDILPYRRGLREILMVHPVSYRYSDGPFAGDDMRYGLIAQEVQKVIPEMVGSATIEDKQFLTVQPGMLVYLLVTACQELAARIDALEKAGDAR